MRGDVSDDDAEEHEGATDEESSGEDTTNSSSSDQFMNRRRHKKSKQQFVVDNMPILEYVDDESSMIHNVSEWYDAVDQYIVLHSMEDALAGMAMIKSMCDEGKRVLREHGIKGVATHVPACLGKGA